MNRRQTQEQPNKKPVRLVELSRYEKELFEKTKKQRKNHCSQVSSDMFNKIEMMKFGSQHNNQLIIDEILKKITKSFDEMKNLKNGLLNLNNMIFPVDKWMKFLTLFRDIIFVYPISEKYPICEDFDLKDFEFFSKIVTKIKTSLFFFLRFVTIDNCVNIVNIE